MTSSKPIESRLSFYLSLLISLILVAVVILLVDFPDHSLEQARQEGIVSRTILDNYNDHQETLQYGFAVLASPILTLFLFSLIGRGDSCGDPERAPVQGKAISSSKPGKVVIDPKKKFFLILLRYVLPAILVVFVSYDPHFIHRWFYFDHIMIDEGSHLAWINEILHGRVLYRDSFYLYGPLATYPAAYLMKIFGVHLSVWRTYILVSGIVGLLVLFYSLFSFGLSEMGRWVAVILFTILYYPVLPSFSWVALRAAAGLLAVVVYIGSVKNGRRFLILLSGFISSIALFYSQEVGISAIATIGACMALSRFRDFSPRSLLSQASLFLLGALPPTVLVLAFFSFHDALSAFLSGFFSGPRLFILGWGAVPFPDFFHDASLLFREFSWEGMAMFFRSDVAFYFPVVLYLGLLSYYLIKLWYKAFSFSDFPYLACLLFGVVLFNSTLARSDESHLLFACLPAVILSVKIVGHLIQSQRVRKAFPAGLAIALGVFIVIGIASLLSTGEGWIKILAIKNRITGSRPYQLQWSLADPPPDLSVLRTPRARGLRAPYPFVRTVDGVVSFIRKQTRPDEPIFCFPNEAAWYFFTGRPDATSYVLGQQMITKAMRENALSQLSENKPRYVIAYDTSVDSISIRQLDPELIDYVEKNYKVIKSFPAAQIAERISSR
jgi:hypothetical protein